MPAAWGSFSGNGSHSVRLARNNITGALPASWQAFVWRAAFVDLSANRLSGALPAEWNATAALSAYPVSIQSLNVRFVKHRDAPLAACMLVPGVDAATGLVPSCLHTATLLG